MVLYVFPLGIVLHVLLVRVSCHRVPLPNRYETVTRRSLERH